MVRQANPITYTLGVDLSSSGGSASDLVTATGTTTPRLLEDRFADALSVLDFGADNTGAVDAGPAFQAANDACVANGSLYFEVPAGDYLINSQVLISDSVWMHGRGKARCIIAYTDVTSQPKVFKFNGNHNWVDGIFFDQTGYVHLNIIVLYFQGLGVGQGSKVFTCRFLLNSGSSVYGDVRITELEVYDCYFFTGSFGVFFTHPVRCRVHDNRMVGCGRGIQFYGGHQNIVQGNHITGGISPINFLSFRSQGALGNICHTNIVANNHVFACTEEGIAFDGRYNDSTNWPENPTNRWINVSSLTTPSPVGAGWLRINTVEVGQATNWASSYWAVPINGNALGQPMVIGASGNGFIDIDRSNGDPPLAAADRVVITSGFFNNVIIGNTCEGCVTHTGGAGEGSIAMWGGHWGTVIIGNTIRDSGNHGINVSSQVSVATGSNPAGFAGFCLIHGNSIHLNRAIGGVSTAGYPIKVYTKNYGGLIPTTIHTPGIEVKDNIILSQSPIYIEDCNGTIIEGNKLLYSSDIQLVGCTNVRFGVNYKLNVRMTGASESGGTTGTINSMMPAIANLGAAPTQADFNNLLAELRAAEYLIP
jgi:hypothetical protein